MHVLDFHCPLEIGGTWIELGDLIFGDLDGVVVVPRRHEVEVIERALEKGPRREARSQGNRKRHVEHRRVQEVRDSVIGGRASLPAFLILFLCF
jgi:regulator of RNase E activity RraA